MFLSHNSLGRFATVTNPCTCAYRSGVTRSDHAPTSNSNPRLAPPFNATANCPRPPPVPPAVCAFQFDIHAATGGDGGESPVSSTVAGEGGAKWYTVHGTCCQPAVFCFCPWGECARVRLQVYEAADVGRERPVGEVARVFPGCCKAEFTEADDFTLAFPGADHVSCCCSHACSGVAVRYPAIDDTTVCRNALSVRLSKPSQPQPAGIVCRRVGAALAFPASRAAALSLTPPPLSSAACLLQGLKRASLVSSVLLLNYLYYEGKRKRHNRGGGGGGGFASN